MNLNIIFEYALSYSRYRKLVDQLILEGKTTGNNQSEKLTEFTKLNIQRMSRIDKTTIIDSLVQSKLENISNSYRWLIIGDAWCGDCAQIVPLVNKVAEISRGKIDFRIISRDTFPDLMDQFKTGGSKSIPKLLVINSTTNEVFATWGPRPNEAQNIMLRWKENKDNVSWDEFERNLHTWYARDRGNSTIMELTTLLEKCERNSISQL